MSTPWFRPPTTYVFGTNTSFINATLSIPTDNPVKRLLFKDAPYADTYGHAFLSFYVLNTGAFVLSMAVIMFVLPVLMDLFALLHGALLFMMIAYGYSFSLISPSYGYSQIFFTVSYGCAMLVYICSFMAAAIGVVDNRSWSRILLASELQRKRRKMLKRLLENME